MSETTSIPSLKGYQLHQIIGEGGMATVYAGVHVATQDPVAVKILSAELSADEEFKARFLKGARLHQSLQHPNVSKVLDFGESPGGCYLVTEHLSGGDLNERLQRGMHIQALIKIVKDMARALDYAHAVGVIHRDIKPENILFRADGTAVLTDFGIAGEASDEPTKSSRGTVVGTPEYMSPEQAAGRPLDGRSDLYSLGVVLYRMLTGDLPYHADTAVSIALKHHQDPIPRLPNYLHAFQDVIDKLLAKRPEQRFARGEDVVDALEALRGSPTMPEATIKTQPISTQEILAVGGDLLSTSRDTDRQERHTRRRKRRRRLRMAASVLLVSGTLGGGAYYAFDQGWVVPERILAQLGLGEDPQLMLAWSEAQSLRQDPNQGLAAIVAAYRRVLALDSGHTAARQEVASLASDWKQAINEALVQGNLETAQARLDEASSVFPNDLQWVQLDVELQNRLRAERIMVSAQALLTSNGMSDLPSATAAIQSFQEVLRLAPEKDAARQALNGIAVHYADLASQAAQSGEVSAAINLLERATAADGTLTELDDVRRLISQATTAQATISDLLQQARRYRAENRLIEPPGENAAELYHRVLATDPGNAIATQGLDEVTSQITTRVDQLLAQGRLDDVSLMVTQAASAGMSEVVISDIRGRLDTEQERLQTVGSNLEKARSLMADGYLTAPSDNNAVAFLREVQQLDPGNAEAQALLVQCAERLAEVAKEAHEFGLHDAAEQYLDLALTITPEVAAWVALRDSWEGEGLAAEGDQT